MPHSLNPHDIARLKALFADSHGVLQEIEDLSEGLSETIKAIAKELDIKPSLLKKALKQSFSNKIEESREDFETIEEILEAVGKGQ